MGFTVVIVAAAGLLAAAPQVDQEKGNGAQRSRPAQGSRHVSSEKQPMVVPPPPIPKAYWLTKRRHGQPAPVAVIPPDANSGPSAQELFQEADKIADRPGSGSVADLFEEAEQAAQTRSSLAPYHSGGVDAHDVLTPEGNYTIRTADSQTLWAGGLVEQFYDQVQQYKKDFHFPIGFAAWHWQHQNNHGPLQSGYGIPGIRGTYWWSIYFDPQLELDHPAVQRIGIHHELRLREQDAFRSFFNEKVYWWEFYGWLDTPLGRFKGGQIWKRFGLDWDGPFFGNVPYFDGFKLDPDLGLALEGSHAVHSDLSVAYFLQFFVHEDGVNGTIVGSDPESLVGSNERNTAVVRAVPTWKLSQDSSLAIGLSGLIGRIDNQFFVGVPSQTLSSWAVDTTFTKGRWRFMAEVLQAYGVLNPVRYTSGGPSNRLTNALVAIQYIWGPCTFRFSYSAGFDANPEGWQQLWLPGITIALAKNVDLYLEWTRWDVFGNPNGSGRNGHIEFEDGFSFVINWRL
ncbi:MAG: hypothetical protein KatS3mg105_0349 [Gemmatales bacterium]|nr:MAG: hypothetical protein KatS3mg105_0349 [Gemmatales bacterium]